MTADSQTGRILGLVRSLAVYHAIPLRQRRLRRLYARFTGPGDLTFDLGAHAGNRTRALASLGCRVVALEPQPDFARLLRALFGRKTNVKIIEAAVGEQAGRAALSISDRTPTMTTVATQWRDERAQDPVFSGVRWNRGIEVDTLTLDALIVRFGMPTFIKIDVEGAEPRVLAGLSQPVRALSFEYLPRALDYTRACIAQLTALGPYRFNWSAGESYELAVEQWMTGDELAVALETPQAQRRSGDVYARLNVENWPKETGNRSNLPVHRSLSEVGRASPSISSLTTPSMAEFDAADVRRYYNLHTDHFVTYGPRGAVGALHRAVWGPGADSQAAAFRYVEDRILEHLRTQPQGPDQVHVVDLGCGVGASLCYLAERLQIRGTGVTLSPVQVRHAEHRIRQAGLSDRVMCFAGDYCALPEDTPPADLAYAIESFVHGPDPARFFHECARLLRPGGLLVICDDFRQPVTEPTAIRTVEQFRRGWYLNTLLHPDELQTLATEAGFEHVSTRDLTPYLEVGRLRDRLATVFIALFGWLPLDGTRFGHLLGGSALQTCLARGWIKYDLALFRRR